MIAYSLTTISCIFELFSFLTSAPLSFELSELVYQTLADPLNS